MATGDTTGPKRPRYQANERFDVGDADAASRAPVEHLDAFQRALISSPRITGGTSPTGLIFTGLSITLNPTAPNDGKVRINTELGVAVDANGRFIVKPAGVTVDVTIPLGGYQLYLYWAEVATDTAQRRFLTVLAPFVEFPAAMAVSFQSTYGTYVRAGTAANIVQEDTVNGVTTPLVCIGTITNAAGVCSMPGRPDNVSILAIPNGTNIINRFANVEAPTIVPGRTYNGSARTLQGLISTNSFLRGRATFLGAKSTQLAYSTTSSATGLLSWTEAGAAWVVNELTGCILQDSAGAFWRISSNTATVLTLGGALLPGGGVVAAGTPTAGAGFIWGPVALNNFGAYTEPSFSLQALIDIWSNFFTATGNLVMPSGTHIDLPANTYLTLSNNSSYIHAPGTLFVGRQKFTAGGTYTPTAGVARVVVRMVGGGGGGGACGVTGAGTGAAGGGGASGTYFEQVFTGAPITGGAVAIGAAGAAGVGGAGGTGGDTTVVINGVTYTAKGGGGGPFGTQNLSPPALKDGGHPQAGSSAGDFTQAAHGFYGIVAGNAGGHQAQGGTGASGMMGIGGVGNDAGAGSDGTGYGAGGGAAGAYNGVGGFNGGAGTAGVLIIDEYR